MVVYDLMYMPNFMLLMKVLREIRERRAHSKLLPYFMISLKVWND